MAANPMGSRILQRANSMHASRIDIAHPPSSHEVFVLLSNICRFGIPKISFVSLVFTKH